MSKITLPWMDMIRERLEGDWSKEIDEFINPILEIGEKQEQIINDRFKKEFSNYKKKWKCQECKRERETDGDVIMKVCHCCQKEMIEEGEMDLVNGEWLCRECDDIILKERIDKKEDEI